MYALLFIGIFACTDSVGDADQSSTDTEDPFTTTQLSDGGSWLATWTSEPAPVPPNELFDLRVSLEATGEAGDVLDVIIDAGMPEHGHGMNVTPEVTEEEDGTWLASPMKFHMTGEWTLLADITTDERTERVTWLIDCCEVN